MDHELLQTVLTAGGVVHMLSDERSKRSNSVFVMVVLFFLLPELIPRATNPSPDPAAEWSQWVITEYHPPPEVKPQ